MVKFEELSVYKKALIFVKNIYSLTRKFPKEEKFGLTDQIRRAGVSVVANIAEGSGRFHDRDFIQFLRIAKSSAYETIALLQISLEEKYLLNKEYESSYNECVEVIRMINGLINSIDRGIKK